MAWGNCSTARSCERYSRRSGFWDTLELFEEFVEGGVFFFLFFIFVYHGISVFCWGLRTDNKKFIALLRGQFVSQHVALFEAKGRGLIWYHMVYYGLIRVSRVGSFCVLFQPQLCLSIFPLPYSFVSCFVKLCASWSHLRFDRLHATWEMLRQRAAMSMRFFPWINCNCPMLHHLSCCLWYFQNYVLKMGQKCGQKVFVMPLWFLRRR